MFAQNDIIIRCCCCWHFSLSARYIVYAKTFDLSVYTLFICRYIKTRIQCVCYVYLPSTVWAAATGCYLFFPVSPHTQFIGSQKPLEATTQKMGGWGMRVVGCMAVGFTSFGSLAFRLLCDLLLLRYYVKHNKQLSV